MSVSIGRNYYFDNARFILIILVVFGHLLSPFRGDSQFLMTTYNFIYSFHMPAFILIAGYFSKGFTKKGYLQKVVRKVLVPYIIFQLIYSLLYTIRDQEVTFSILNPYWTLWFLLSLLLWNLLLFVFVRIRFSLLLATLLGITVGYFEGIGTFLSLSRTLVFFPIFLLGYYLNDTHFKLILNTKTKIISTILMVCLFFGYYLYFPASGRSWLLASSSFTDMGVDQPQYGIMIRLAIYGIMLMTTFCFLCLVPKRQYFFTHLGSKTLYVYLLHGLIVKLILTAPIFDYTNTFVTSLLFIILAIVISFLLASTPVTTFARPLIEWNKGHFMQKNKQNAA